MHALVCQGLSSRGKVTSFPSHWEYVSLLYECYLFFSDLLLTPHEIPGPGVTENGEMPCRCWERSLSPLEKQLLPTDPSLQPFGLPLEGEKDKTLLTWGFSCSTPTCLSEHRDCPHMPPGPAGPGSGDSNSCPHPCWQVLSPPSRLPSSLLWSVMERLFPDFCLTFHSLEEEFPVSIKSKLSVFVYFLVTVSASFCPGLWEPKNSVTPAGRLLKELTASSSAPFLCPVPGSTRDGWGPSIHLNNQVV